MKKQIISETKNYEQSTVDELLLDDTPKVNSFNFVTSDGVARAISGASGEVPVVTENDNGKVLKAIYDAGGPAVEWGEATVDQTYDSTSTNAQSGVAVAQAIAAIPSEVSTASGHFDLGGDVPVKVNYTGTPHVVSDYITLTNPTTTTVGQSLGIVFSTQGNKSLGADTANLVISDTIHAKFTGIYYAMNPPSPGPGITTSTGSITSGTINPQTIVLSGSNPAESFGVGNDVIMLFSDLTDGETAESIMTKVSIQHWPASVVDGYETTIPVVDQNYHSESANAQSGVAVAQAIAAIPSASYTAGDGIAISAQNEVSAKVGGGIVIGNASSTSTVTDNLSVTPVNPEGTRIYPIFGRLTADTANALASGSVTIKSLINWSNNAGYTYYRPCIFVYDSSWGYNFNTRLVFGTNPISGSITANTEIVYDLNDVNATLSSGLTIETILANPANYVFFANPCSSDGNITGSYYFYSSASSSSAAVISTASYQGTVTVPNSIVMEHPIEVVSSMPASPTSGVLYIVTGA